MSNDSSNLRVQNNSRQSGYGPLAATLLVVVSFFAAQFLASLAVSLYPELRHWSADYSQEWLRTSAVAQFVYVLFSEGIVMLILWWFLRRQRIAWRYLGLTRPKLKHLGLMIPAVLAYFALYSLLLALVHAVAPINVDQQQSVGFQDAANLMSLSMAFISLVLLPPLVEEITFRGFLYGGLRRAFGKLGGVLATSLLFAIPHLLGGADGKLLWVAGVDTFALSIVLCYLREKTGSIWTGVGVHALKNGLAFVLLFVVQVH